MHVSSPSWTFLPPLPVCAYPPIYLGPYRALYRLPTSCVLHARWRTPVNAPLLFVPYISVYVTESRKTVLMHLFAGVETQTQRKDLWTQRGKEGGTRCVQSQRFICSSPQRLGSTGNTLGSPPGQGRSLRTTQNTGCLQWRPAVCTKLHSVECFRITDSFKPVNIPFSSCLLMRSG